MTMKLNMMRLERMNKIYCPKCNSENLIKKGINGGKQNYLCKDCGSKTINPLEMVNVGGIGVSGTLVQKTEDDDVFQVLGLENKIVRLQRDLKASNAKFSFVSKQLDLKTKALDAAIALNSNKLTKEVFKVKATQKDNEAAAMVVLSDLHLEERVDAKTVNGINEFNLEIAERRLKNVFVNALKLINIHRTDIKIQTIVLFLLGDIISGTIHDELLESNYLSPTNAILFADRLLSWGIDYILDNSDLNLFIPTCPGNHGRTTHKTRINTYHDNSYEQLLYRNLQKRYEKEKRIVFQVSESYLNYVQVFDFVIRAHHGDFIKGSGSNLKVPFYKAIAEWNSSRPADLDVIGHYHNYTVDRKFIVNGSLVGYNAFGMSIKASAEPPCQFFGLIDKKRNRLTVTAPIFVD